MLRLEDFGLVMREIYDFFFDAKTHLCGWGLKRLDDMLRPAAMSGLVSDMITASMARHSRVLVENRYHNGHPDPRTPATPTALHRVGGASPRRSFRLLRLSACTTAARYCDFPLNVMSVRSGKRKNCFAPKGMHSR
ncbi:MAG: hypothetical protein OXH14_14875 [Alphaproteobacteria bacterium]|nr:hypothetical protein [Alphaproteobacteria bacterium]